MRDRYRYREISGPLNPEGKPMGKLILRDDGYRIHARWIDPTAVNVNPEEWLLWAEYKHCEFPAIGFRVADLLMNSTEPVA